MVKKISLAVIYLSCMAIAYFGVKLFAYYFGGKMLLIAIPVIFMVYFIYRLTVKQLAKSE